jgi:hypothetical protein
VRDNISVQARLNLFLNYFSDFIEDDMYVWYYTKVTRMFIRVRD